MKKIFPFSADTAKLADKVSARLMQFVCHNQKAGKKLNDFIALGCHDMRAGSEALEILRIIDEFLNEE